MRLPNFLFLVLELGEDPRKKKTDSRKSKEHIKKQINESIKNSERHENKK